MGHSIPIYTGRVNSMRVLKTTVSLLLKLQPTYIHSKFILKSNTITKEVFRLRQSFNGGIKHNLILDLYLPIETDFMLDQY